MKILLLGAHGQLGTDLVHVFTPQRHELVLLTHKDVEVTDPVACKNILAQHKPEIVINTTAYHVVDQCEDNALQPFLVNVCAIKHLATLCNEHNSTLVHFSTDYVFDGKKKKPYTEDDIPHPLSVYAMSKYAGELMLQRYCKKYFLVRSSGLYGVAGSSGKGGNFVETMIRLAREGKPIKVVNDQVLTPTATKALARKLAQLIQTSHYGLYHITNNGECSWYAFAQKIFEYLQLTPQLSPITSHEFGAQAQRPAYSVLDNHNLRKLGMDDLPPWTYSLKEYLREKGHLK